MTNLIKFNDKLQMKISAKLLKGGEELLSHEAVAGFVMMGEGIFFDEAVARVKQARESITIVKQKRA